MLINVDCSEIEQKEDYRHGISRTLHVCSRISTRIFIAAFPPFTQIFFAFPIRSFYTPQITRGISVSSSDLKHNDDIIINKFHPSDELEALSKTTNSAVPSRKFTFI